MKAKDTVMDDVQIEEAKRFHSGYTKHIHEVDIAIAQAQAEISFKAGREEGWKDAQAYYHIDTG